MCGIAGYWGDIAPESATALLQAMNASLAHRGPDGEGMWVGPHVGLGHRRLAIIDLAGGGQPMASADGRYRIVFNGEIYNYQFLRGALEAVGYKFLTRSDTEVIPAAVDYWGIEKGLSKLRGMFAFALYDLYDQSLLMARDPFGIKPLYIGYAPGLIVFGSEPKALLTYNNLSRRIDPVTLLDFFTLAVPLSPRTGWAAIRELMPGTWLKVSHEGERRGNFWGWPCSEGEALTEAEAVEGLESVLRDSLRAHLESDVPIAAFLSGGIDSSVLVALLCKHFLPSLNTFNVGFDEVGYDESPHARAVAVHCGSQHYEKRILAGEGRPEIFQRIVEQYDQPFGDSSCLPTWLICREMAQHTKVVISGDGGDEMFGGYNRYWTIRRLKRLGWLSPLPSLVTALGCLTTWSHPEIARRLQKAATFARLPLQQMLCALNTYYSLGEVHELFQPEFLKQALVEGPTHERFAQFMPEQHFEPTEQFMATEIRSLLHADSLRKVDIASSAHGLEVRTPYLDIEVFRYASKIPLSLKVRRKSLKHVLRLLARNLLPHSAIDRPKQGFGIPFDRWISTGMQDFLHDLLVSPAARSRDFLHQAKVQELLKAFSGNTDPRHLSRYQVYQRVFMLASFELWLRKWSATEN
jgi:asparagine synthase (glutamine-hydrolysing)